MLEDDRTPAGAVLRLLAPAVVAMETFFSWVMLINNLRIPFSLYYERTIFLIYVSRSYDPVIWLILSALASILVAVEVRGRPILLWSSVLLLWFGFVAGGLFIIGILPGQIVLLGALATLTGSLLGVVAAIKGSISNNARDFTIVFLSLLLLLVLPIELGALTHYVVASVHPTIEVGTSLDLLEPQLWYTVFPIVPFMYVAFLVSWAWAPLIPKTLFKSLRTDRNGRTGTRPTTKTHAIWRIVIAGYILLACFLGYYAYFHDPSYSLVGTDIYWRNALPAQRVLSSTSWLVAAARERHPLVALTIATVSSLLGLKVDFFLRFIYVGLIIGFGTAVYILTLRGSHDKGLAFLGALIASVSPVTTIGMYTGTVQEWIPLIIWVFSLVPLAVDRFENERRYILSALCLGLGSIAVLLFHPWTWAVMMLGLLAYCFVLVMFRVKTIRRDLELAVGVILTNVTLGFLVFLTAQGWSRVTQAFSLLQGTLSTNYFGFANNEVAFSLPRIWGQFFHPALIILSTLGIVVLVRRRDRFAAVVLSWLVAAGIATLLAGDYETQIRALFLVPFQIPAAFGLLFLKSTAETKMMAIVGSRNAKVIATLASAIIMLAIVNGALRAIFPLLTDPHNYPDPSRP